MPPPAAPPGLPVKPPPFGYEAPDTLEEAVQLLGQHGDEAKVLAGGQSLMPLLAFRLARPSLLVDINRIRELEFLRHVPGTLELGSLTRHRTVELAGSPAVPAAIAEAAAQIGHVAIRNRGTVGGSLAHADPSAEWGAVTLAYDGIIVARSAAGGRRVRRVRAPPRGLRARRRRIGARVRRRSLRAACAGCRHRRRNTAGAVPGGRGRPGRP